MMGTTAGSSNQNLNVFTAAQWEELEQQALIYKYMVSGVPVPTDLILSVRRSLYNSSSSSLSNQPTLGVWEGGFQYNNQLYQIGGVSGYGHGRKIDLEPGRCRRTDGKKWRCSKEAYPDSKYCERHMHRGRNRSRKPVEFPSSSSSTSSSSTATSLSVSSSPSTTLSKSISHSDTYPQFSSIQTNFMDYRYLQGMKELGEDEKSAYLHLHDPYTNIQKMTPHHQHHHNYSHFNFQNLKEQQQQQQHKQEEATQGQHCYVMGTDFIKSREEKSTSQINTKSDETTGKQPFHHFFSTPKTTPNPTPNPNHNTDPAWVEIDQHQHQHQHHFINPTKSTLSTQDLFQSTPRPYW